MIMVLRGKARSDHVAAFSTKEVNVWTSAASSSGSIGKRSLFLSPAALGSASPSNSLFSTAHFQVVEFLLGSTSMSPMLYRLVVGGGVDCAREHRSHIPSFLPPFQTATLRPMRANAEEQMMAITLSLSMGLSSAVLFEVSSASRRSSASSQLAVVGSLVGVDNSFVKSLRNMNGPDFASGPVILSPLLVMNL